MKKLLFISLLLSCILSIAQQSSDIVFPVKGKPIKDCTVFDVGPANMVSYITGEDTLSITSKAYIKEGVFYDVFFNVESLKEEYIRNIDFIKDTNLKFEENRDYYYHENLFNKYKKQSKIGIPFLGAGLLFVSSGLGIYYTGGNLIEYYFNESKGAAIALIYLGGLTMATGGIIIGVNSSKAVQAKREMEKLNPRQVSLNIGMQQNGFGMSLRF